MGEEIIDVSKLSDMMKQYMAIKENYSDCLLFFRLGDFYEMFFDDAVVASREDVYKRQRLRRRWGGINLR